MDVAGLVRGEVRFTFERELSRSSVNDALDDEAEDVVE
jgi:hypothetical protein